MPKDIENNMVIGDYYPEPERPQADPDAAYDAWVQYQIDHPEEFEEPARADNCHPMTLQDPGKPLDIASRVLLGLLIFVATCEGCVIFWRMIFGAPK
jgi:hypothetical protein